mmetsp:Transcript_30767/g.43082  ORF Transcript_30767/g.43082 Transcript_30767/m.43082 type:complete len:125 (+) Transcript_30767:255-629(+)
MSLLVGNENGSLVDSAAQSLIGLMGLDAHDDPDSRAVEVEPTVNVVPDPEDFMDMSVHEFADEHPEILCDAVVRENDAVVRKHSAMSTTPFLKNMKVIWKDKNGRTVDFRGLSHSFDLDMRHLL